MKKVPFTLGNTRFAKNFATDNDKVKENRKQQVITQAQRAYKKEIDDLKDKLLDKQVELDKLNDFSPRTDDDLLYRNDFNASEWAKSRIDVVSKMEALEYKIKTLQEDYNYWFTDIKEPSNDSNKEAK